MKRFISLLVALVLLVSMFALPMFALAQEPDTTEGEGGAEKARTVGFNTEAFEKYVIASNKGLYVEMEDKFQLNLEWTDEEGNAHDWTDVEAIVRELFPGISYFVLPEARTDIDEETEQEYTITYRNGLNATEEPDDEEDSETAEVVTDTRYAGQYVTLKSESTFEAEEGFEFVGWRVSITYDGQESGESLLYRAGDKFVMPEHDIEVVAEWREIPENKDDAEKIVYTYTNDIICLEYITPSDDPRDSESWSRVALDDVIILQSSGWWMFRYAVVDGENGDITDKDAVLTTYDTEEFKESIMAENGGVFSWEKFCLKRYAVDTSHPEVALSESMKTKQDDGLTVGETYSISTALTITDSSTTTTTYKVYRHSGNGTTDENDSDWVLIYDSEATDRVIEGGELYISSAGVITPISSDVTEDGNYRYKIVYSVKDAEGFFGASEKNGTVEYHPVLLLGVHFSTEDEATLKRMEAWKIALFVIAGLAAAGIVALLLIKPKKVVAGDTRVNAVSAGSDAKKGDSQADTLPDDQSNGEE